MKSSQTAKSFKPKTSTAASKQKNKKKTAATEKQKESPKPEPEAETPSGLECNLRDIAKVLLEEPPSELKDSGKWPLLIDPSSKATTFLRYRDSNYLCTANSNDMAPETVRRALIGSIRFGKPFLIDMLDTDMFDIMEKVFNEILPNLMADLMNKDIMKDEKYMKLVKPEDGSMYDNFDLTRLDSFMFIVATTKQSPPASLLKVMLPVRVQSN